MQTRSGRYRVAWIPLPVCPIPGWSACIVQAVRADSPGHAIRLTLYERIGDGPQQGPDDGPRAA